MTSKDSKAPTVQQLQQLKDDITDLQNRIARLDGHLDQAKAEGNVVSQSELDALGRETEAMEADFIRKLTQYQKDYPHAC
jgi:uncharacterized protein (DUF3084 family)